MKSIVYKNYKEFILNKFNLVVLFLPSLIYIILEIRDVNFELYSIFLNISNLIIFYLMFYLPKTFALEKDNKTLETLISTPILFKTVLISTLIFYVICVNIPAIFYFLCSILYTLFIGGDFSIIFNIAIVLFMAIIVSINMVLAGLIVSIKSENVIACSLKIVYTLIAYLLPFTVALSVLKSNLIDNLMVFCVYAIINLVIFFISYAKAKLLFNKPILLSTYTKGV